MNTEVNNQFEAHLHQCHVSNRQLSLLLLKCKNGIAIAIMFSILQTVVQLHYRYFKMFIEQGQYLFYNYIVHFAKRNCNLRKHNIILSSSAYSNTYIIMLDTNLALYAIDFMHHYVYFHIS